MTKKIILWGLFLGLFCLCVGWLSSLVITASKNESRRRGAATERAERAASATGPIYIGAVGDWNIEVFRRVLRGIEQAATEVNLSGGVLGRELKILLKNDENSVVQGRKVAQELADNLDVVAVIGHPTSKVSIPTSVIYEYYGLVMMSPMATSSKLTRQGYQRVFRNIPSNDSIGEQMALFANEQGYKRVGIYYLRDDYGRGLANAFERKAQESGINVIDRLAYDSSFRDIDFQRDLKLWTGNFSLDAIFLAGFVPQGALFIKEARALGIDVPIFCGEGMESESLITIAGESAEGVVVASAFDPDSFNSNIQSFTQTYLKLYGSVPDMTAAQGYDAVKLLAFAIEKAGSTVPEEIANALRAVDGWQGVTGPHWFAENGDVINKPIVTKVVKNGKFHFLKEVPVQTLRR